MRNATRIAGSLALVLAALIGGTSPLGAAPAVPVTGDLQLWLDASNTASLTIDSSSRVSAWNDVLVGGNTTAHDAIQGTTDQQPVWIESVPGLGGKSAVRFDGEPSNSTGDSLSIASLALDNTITAFFVTQDAEQNTNPGSCCRPFFSGADSIDGTGYSFGLERSDYNDGEHFRYDPPGQSYSVGDVLTQDGSFHIYSYQRNGTTSNGAVLDRDGTQIFQHTATGNATQANYEVGWDGVSSARHYEGDVAEIIIYDSVLAADEVEAIGVYLQNKYGISGSFANDVILDATGAWDAGANWDGGAAPTSGADAYAGGGFTATVSTAGQAAGSLTIGHDVGTYNGDGTVSVTGGELDVVGNVNLGQTGRTGTLAMTGGTVSVGGGVIDGGGTSTLNVDGGTLSVDGDLKVDSLRVGMEQQTGSVSAGGVVEIGASGNLDIGRRAGLGTVLSKGTVDFSSATSVNLDLDNLRLGTVAAGYNATTSSGQAQGILLLSPDNTITATTITLGDSIGVGNSSNLTQMVLGAANVIRADTMYVAQRKSDVEVSFAGSGTLDLKNKAGTGRANLYLGYNNSGTSISTEGQMDLSGGVFTAQLDNLVLGYSIPSNSSTGTGTLTLSDSSANDVDVNNIRLGDHAGGNASGTLAMGGGTVTVNGSVLDAGGTSTLNVDGGTMNIAGDLRVDSLRIGMESRTGSVSAGGVVAIGNGSGNFDLGRRTQADGASNLSRGTADFTSASSVDIDVAELRLGTITHPYAGGTSDGTANGILKLGTANTITATTVTVGDSPQAGNTSVISEVVLGATNDFRTDGFYVARRKSRANVSFAAGGTLDLKNKAGTGRANLYVGYNDTGTSIYSNGLMDLSGGTFTALLDSLVIGRKVGSSTGTATGQLTLSANAANDVDVNNVTIGEALGGTTGLASGTLDIDGGSFTVNNSLQLGLGTPSSGTVNLSGGTLTAASISKGPGTASFNFTGGTLHVGSFGFDLVQDGGTLAPGTSPGLTEIAGDYVLNAGTLEIEIDAAGTAGVDYDQVQITGGDLLLDQDGGAPATLAVVPGSGFSPTANDLFWIVNNTGSGDTYGMFDGLNEGEAVSVSGRNFYIRYHADFDSQAFTGGNDVLLTSVPEPSTLVLLVGGGLVGLLLRRRRRPAAS